MGRVTTGSPQAFIVSTIDSASLITFGKTYIDTTDDININAITTSADGYIYLTGVMGSNLLVVKMDTSGNQQWVKTYSMTMQGYSISKAVTGNGVILTGSLESSSGSSMAVVEMDSSGEFGITS